MSNKKYTLTEDVVRDHLSNLINSDKLGNEKNMKHVLDIILLLPEHSINILMKCSILKDSYQLLKIGDFVTYQPSAYTAAFGDRDILMDKGLMTKDGYVFGTIEMDGSWNSADEFDPYHAYMKINFFVWGTNDISHYEEKVTTYDLKLVDKFPEFNTPTHQDFLEIEDEIAKDAIIQREKDIKNGLYGEEH